MIDNSPALEIGRQQARRPSAIDQEQLRDLEEKRELWQAASLLWKRRQLVMKAAVIGLLASLALAFLLPVQYEAVTQLMPPSSQSVSGSALMALAGNRVADSLTEIAGDALPMKTTSSLFVGVLQSRTVHDRLINRFDLRKIYWVKRYETARKKLAQRTTISEDRKSGIITIAVLDRDPRRAAGMATAYVEELDRLTTELNTSAAHRERVFIEGRLNVVEQQLEQAQKALSAFSSKNAALDIKEQGRTMVEAAARLQGELIAAQSELMGLQQIYSDNNVRVRVAHAQVVELQKQLQKLGGSSGSSASPGDPEQLYPSIRQLPLLGVTYADLYRRTRVLEVVFETLTKQYEMAKINEAKEIPSIKVLDPAVPPEQRKWPPRLAISIGGMFFCMVCAAVWVLARRGWQTVDAEHPLRQLASEIAGDFKRRRIRWSS